MNVYRHLVQDYNFRYSNRVSRMFQLLFLRRYEYEILKEDISLHVRFEDLTAVVMNSAIFWDIAP
jgi:hypothetical protein